jgi:hypothetical protein
MVVRGRHKTRRGTRRRHAVVGLVAALVASTVSGCGEPARPTTTSAKPSGEPTAVSKTLSWDLSRGRSLGRVRWPAQGTMFQMTRGVQANVALAPGKAFRGRVEKVMGLREGGNIRQLNLFYPASTTDEGYQRAKSVAKAWGIKPENLDKWHQRRKKQRAAGKEDLSDTAFTGSYDGKRLGESGPKPAVEVLNSFDKERPVVVSLTFLWPRPGQ